MNGDMPADESSSARVPEFRASVWHSRQLAAHAAGWLASKSGSPARRRLPSVRCSRFPHVIGRLCAAVRLLHLPILSRRRFHPNSSPLTGVSSGQQSAPSATEQVSVSAGIAILISFGVVACQVSQQTIDSISAVSVMLCQIL